jgi:Protein of unknown function (DUF3987)
VNTSELLQNAPEYAVPSETPWQVRSKLPDVSPDPKDMTEEMLPDALRGWIVDAAKRACVHVAFIAVIAMSSVGAVVGRTLGIHPKRRDDWLELPNLWAAIIAPPSSLKSHAVSEGTMHLKRLAVLATQNYKSKLSENKAKREILELELSDLRKEAKNAAKRLTYLSQIQSKLEEIEALEAVTERRYIANDVTMEKAGELLVQNPRGLLLLRDELVGLLKACDKSGYEAYRPFLLEAWNGKGSYSFDRIGRGTLHVPSVTLSLCGGIQPGRLRSYIMGAIGEDEGADGLLQRFQLLTWFDHPRAWQRVDETPDKEARERAYRLFEFFDLKLPDLTTKVQTFEPDDIPGLRFSDEAQELFNTWLDSHMTRLRSGELDSTPAFQAHLTKYNKLVPALALLFHLCDLGCHDANNLTRVSGDALNLAIAWAEYLEQHARKLYALELNTSVVNAHALVEKILSGELSDSQNLSNIYQRKMSRLTKAAEVEAALKVLEGIHRIRLEEIKNEGARATKVIRLHPELREKA